MAKKSTTPPAPPLPQAPAPTAPPPALQSSTSPPSTPKAPKTPKAPAFDRARELEKLRAEINKAFTGKNGVAQGALQPADHFANMFLLRRPFGITGLDAHTAGGPPAGGLIEIVGPEGSCKTYLSNLVIAGVQQVYGQDACIGLAMTEMHYDKLFAKACGVKVALSDVEIQMWNEANSRTGLPPLDPKWATEQVGYMEEAYHETAEGILEAAATMVERNLFQVVVIDSIGAMAPNAEMQGTILDRHYAGSANPITSFMHRYHSAMNAKDQWGRPNTTSIIVINQNRDNVGGGMFSVDYKLSGGNALKHGNLLTLRVHPGAKHKVDVAGEKVQVGKAIHWQILKGKAGCHDGVSGEFDFYYGKNGYPFGANFYADLMVAALEFNLVEQDGAWFSYQGERLAQGKENAWRALYENPQLYESLRNQVLNKAGVRYITKESF